MAANMTANMTTNMTANMAANMTTNMTANMTTNMTAHMAANVAANRYCAFLLALLIYVEWLVSDFQLNIDLRGPHFQVQCKKCIAQGPSFPSLA